MRVKEVAEQQGFNMAQLSRRANIDIRTVRRIYRKPTAPISTDTLNRIALALHCSPTDLIENVPDEQTE